METEMTEIYTEPETQPETEPVTEPETELLQGGGEFEIQETSQLPLDYHENFSEIERLLSQIRDSLAESETETELETLTEIETSTESVSDKLAVAGNTINLLDTVLLSAILALLLAVVVFRRM